MTRYALVVLSLFVAAACGGDRSGDRPLAERSALAREAAVAGVAAAPVPAAPVAAAAILEPNEEYATAEAPPLVPPTGATPYYAVQLGLYSDSAALSRTARALTDSGWSPVVHEVTQGRAVRWRLYVAVARDSVLPEFVAAGVRVAGAAALVVRDTFTGRELGGALIDYQALPVVRTPTLTATTRWMLSPDSAALLAVEDGAGARGEARPDGVVFANERLDCYARFEDAWDVSPAPDWRRLAYGYVARPAASDSAVIASADGEPQLVGALPADEGAIGEPARRDLVARTRTAMITLPRRGRVWFGRGQPTLLRTDLPVRGGWRVRWSSDGRVVYSGSVPRTIRDDAAAREWTAVPDTGLVESLSTDEARRLPDANWKTGPTLDPSLPVLLTGRAAPAARGRITSVGGWIRVTTGRWRGRRGRILGPGVLLAATRDGNFVLALAPQVGARRDAPTAQLVVYATGSGRRTGSRECGVADAPG
jgi:hypothetical protein